MQQVEGEQMDGYGPQQAGGWRPDMHAVGQDAEAWRAVLIQSHDLAVEDHRSDTQRGGVHRDLGKAAGDVPVVTAQDPDLVSDVEDRPDAVIFGLERPAGSGGKWAERGEHGPYEPWELLSHIS